MKTCKEKLEYQLKKNNIRPHTLAKAATVPESSIKNILYGKSLKPRIELVQSMGKVLNCSTEELLSDDDPRISEKQATEAESWNGKLYIAALQAVMDTATLKGITLNKQEAILHAKRIYKYAVVNNENGVDMKFANYLLS